MSSFLKALRAIQSERAYQKATWGDDSGKSSGDFLVYMQTYLTRAMVANTKDINVNAALHEIRKVTALGIACLERHGAPQREGFEVEDDSDHIEAAVVGLGDKHAG